MTQQQKVEIVKALANLRIALTKANPSHDARHDITIKNDIASVNGEEFDITWEVDEILRYEADSKHLCLPESFLASLRENKKHQGIIG